MMPTYDFTPRFTKVLKISIKIAEDLSHEYVGTEHLLLAALSEGEGTALLILQKFGINLEDIEVKTRAMLKRGHATTQIYRNPDTPLTARSKKVIEHALNEANLLDHELVGTGHLLLGMLREEMGLAAKVLFSEGLTLASARLVFRDVNELSEASRNDPLAETSFRNKLQSLTREISAELGKSLPPNEIRSHRDDPGLKERLLHAIINTSPHTP